MEIIYHYITLSDSVLPSVPAQLSSGSVFLPDISLPERVVPAEREAAQSESGIQRRMLGNEH